MASATSSRGIVRVHEWLELVNPFLCAARRLRHCLIVS
jgi:hypothetical protein